jgi:hypothetical protein
MASSAVAAPATRGSPLRNPRPAAVSVRGGRDRGLGGGFRRRRGRIHCRHRWSSRPETVATGTPSSSISVAMKCRRSCRRNDRRPASRRARANALVTQFGFHAVTPSGRELNTKLSRPWHSQRLRWAASTAMVQVSSSTRPTQRRPPTPAPPPPGCPEPSSSGTGGGRCRDRGPHMLSAPTNQPTVDASNPTHHSHRHTPA